MKLKLKLLRCIKVKSAGNQVKDFIKLSLFQEKSERVIPIANHSNRIDASTCLSEKGHRFKRNKIFVVRHSTSLDVTIHLGYLSLKRVRFKNIRASFRNDRNGKGCDMPKDQKDFILAHLDVSQVLKGASAKNRCCTNWETSHLVATFHRQASASFFFFFFTIWILGNSST